MDNLTIIQTVIVWALPVLFAITVHEAAHGWVARRLGDPTAMMLGRLTLNPIKHIDPIGTLLVPGILFLSQVVIAGISQPVIFGWAKPVPVTWENLGNPKRDMALVAGAGPASNLLMAFIWAALMKAGIMLAATWPWLAYPLLEMGRAGIVINLVLMLLNLLPVPPLDGGRVLVSVLPGRLSLWVSRLEPYGLFILLALVISGMLGAILAWPLHGFQRLFYTLLNL